MILIVFRENSFSIAPMLMMMFMNGTGTGKRMASSRRVRSGSPTRIGGTRSEAGRKGTG